MFVESHPSRIFSPTFERSNVPTFRRRTSIPLPHYPPNSFPLNLFADPHSLTPVVSIFYKNMGGQGAFPGFQRSNFPPSNLSTSFLPNSFLCHTSENPPVSPSIATLPKTCVSNPCVCHTSETPRGWGVMVNQPPNRRRSLHPLTAKGLSSTGHGTEGVAGHFLCTSPQPRFAV